MRPATSRVWASNYPQADKTRETDELPRPTLPGMVDSSFFRGDAPRGDGPRDAFGDAPPGPDDPRGRLDWLAGAGDGDGVNERSDSPRFDTGGRATDPLSASG